MFIVKVRIRGAMVGNDLKFDTHAAAYTDWELEAVAHALNTVPLPQEIYEIISDLHSAVMGLMREVRNR
jgi:hypothetical protein